MYPNFVSQVREIEIFLGRLQIGCLFDFFRGFGPRFRVHQFKSIRPAKNAQP